MALKPATKQFRREIADTLKQMGFSPYIRKDNDVVKTSAEISKYYTGQERVGTEIEEILPRISKLKLVSDRLYILADMSFRYGTRITELLELRSFDYKGNGKLFIRGKKGSGNRIVDVGVHESFFNDCLLKKVSPFQDYNYDFVYRQFKKVGISKKMSGNSKSSVTHLGRHLSIKQLRKGNIVDEDIKEYIGHKSLKSTKNYGK